MSPPTYTSRCPACGGRIFWDVLIRVGAPFHRVLPIYLTHVVLDEHGSPILWRYQGSDLADALDANAEGFADTTDPALYCEEYHPVRALALGRTLARLREAPFLTPPIVGGDAPGVRSRAL